MPTKRKILIVDDHLDTLKLMERLLTVLGHDAVGAADPFAALELQRAQAFDLAFIDIGLPGMRGTELLLELHKIRPLAAVSVTGHLSPDEVDEQMRAGFKRCIAKPCQLQDLVKAVDELAG